MPLRIHIPGGAHTKENHDFSHDAYTQKTFKLCAMLHRLGYTVYYYGAEGSNPECTEKVVCVTDKEQWQTYPGWPCIVRETEYDVKNDLAFQVFNQRAISAINQRKQEGDLLLTTLGPNHLPIIHETGLRAVEVGIAYPGTIDRYRVFESAAWMNCLIGAQTALVDTQGILHLGGLVNAYDTVIPAFFDIKDFEFSDRKQDYLLYMGRVIESKGIWIAARVAEKLGLKLIIAGQGNPKAIGLESPTITYEGIVGFEARNQLMQHARCLLAPTLYLEPFGWVTVEAMLCGTPVITTNWGSFPEIIRHGKVGYRCNTLEQFIWAAKNVERLEPRYIRNYAEAKYSMDRIGPMYDEYLQMVHRDVLQGPRAWYLENEQREDLDWLLEEF